MTESQDERAPSRAERTTSRVYGWDEVLFLKPTAEQREEEGKEILGKISWGMQGLCFLLRQANYMCGVSDSRANTARPDVRGGDQMWQSQTDRSTNCDKKCEWRKSESKRPEVFFYLEGKKWREFFLLLFFQTDGCVIVASREKQRYVSRTCQHHNNVLWNQIHSTPNCLGLFAILFNSQKKKKKKQWRLGNSTETDIALW